MYACRCALFVEIIVPPRGSVIDTAGVCAANFLKSLNNSIHWRKSLAEAVLSSQFELDHRSASFALFSRAIFILLKAFAS